METITCIAELLGFIVAIVIIYITVNPRQKTQEKDWTTKAKIEDVYKCPECESVYQDGGKYGEFHLCQANGSYGDTAELETIISKKCNGCSKK